MSPDVFKTPAGLDATLGITYDVLEAEHVVARLSVSDRHHQPFGRMHGGVSVALAESVASVGANLNCPDGFVAVGAEINANHLRPVTQGVIRATARPLQTGRSLQVWEVRVEDDQERLISIARCTIAIIPHRQFPIDQ